MTNNTFSLRQNMDSRKQLGSSGEMVAVEFLKSRGCRILQQNFRCRQGEVDIIASDKDTICFVEVKTRRSLAYGNGLEAVVWHKQQKLTRTAAFYLLLKGWEDRKIRFDVISIDWKEDGQAMIDYIPDAFEPE